MTRSCGRCHACCVHINIPALDKPAGKPCQHLCKGPGCCAIYEIGRPSECQVYSCAWLDGYFPTGMRPDKSGLLLEVATIEHPRHLKILGGSETRPGAAELATKRIEAALPEGSGREQDCQTFLEFMEGCQSRGGITYQTLDRSDFYEFSEHKP